MAWTYNANLLGTTGADADLMEVRFLIQDVSSGDQLVQDAEITWMLTQQPSVWECAASVCRQIALRYAKKATSKSVDGLSLQYSDRAKTYTEMAKNLAAAAKSPSLRTFTPYAGGISASDKETQLQDTDWDLPAFRRGQFDIAQGSSQGPVEYFSST